MSGGHLNSNGYHYHHATEAADELRREAADQVWFDWEGEYRPSTYTPETRATFLRIATLLDAAARAWEEADYLLSGDTWEEAWLSDETRTVLDRLQSTDPEGNQ